LIKTITLVNPLLIKFLANGGLLLNADMALNVYVMQVWKRLGQMPYRGKTVLAAYWDGWLYFTAGQRDKGPADPAPSKIMAKTWRTRLEI